MAYSDQQTIVAIKVDYDKAIEGIVKYREKVEELRQKQQQLREENNDKNTDAQRYAENERDLIILNEKIKEYQFNIRTLSKEVQNNARIEIEANEKRAGSLKDMRAQLSILTKMYDELSAEQRAADAQDKNGLAAQIKALSQEIKDAEAATGRFYRNVGNYENAIQNMLGVNSKWYQQLTMIKDITSGGLKQALITTTTAVTSFGRSLLGLLANPIVAIFAAIAAAIMAVSKAISSSEENTNQWNRLLAPLNGLLTAALRVIQDIVGAILSWVNNGAKLVGWIMTMLEKLPLIGNFLKIINDEIRESIALADEDAQLAKDRREMEMKNADDEVKIQKLRKKAAADAKKDRNAQLAELKQIDDLEKGIAKRREEFAKRDYEHYKAQSERADNTAADNDMLTQKYVAWKQAEASYYQQTTKLAGQAATAEQALSKDIAATGKSAEDTARKVQEAKKKEQDAIRSAEDALVKLITDSYERQRKEVELSYKRRIEDLRTRLETEKDLTLAARQAINTEILAQQRLFDEEMRKLNIENLEKQVNQEKERLSLLLQAAGDDALKRRELMLQQIDAEEALQESAIAREVEDEQKRALVLEALHLAMNAKRLSIEQGFEKQIEDERIRAVQRDFEARIRAHADNELEVLRQTEQMKLAILQESHRLEGESLEEWNARKLQMEDDYVDAKSALAKKEAQIEKEKVQAVGQAVGALGDLMEEAGENNTAAARLAKVLALAEIAINSGVAISAGIKQAQTTGPFPANIAAIATTVAAIMSGITSALKAVKSAKFATGGTITGAGTGTSDSVPAMLSNGESVITANATTLFSPVLSALNQLGGGVPIIAANPQTQLGEDMLAAAVAKGMALAPRPVVSVQEINSVQHRVEVIESIASI